jgi:hypothetical protein
MDVLGTHLQHVPGAVCFRDVVRRCSADPEPRAAAALFQRAARAQVE